MKFLVSLLLLCSVTLQAQDWQYNFQEAKEMAVKEHKPIILVFSGSDWCAPCIKLDKNIWQSADFKNHAADHWILLKADFPRKKTHKLPEAQEKQNAMLAEKYNRSGNFPLIVILDAKGNVLGETGYKNISPAEYIKLFTSFTG